MSTGWRASQSLNTNQWGFRATAINLVLVGTQAAGVILAVDPNDNTVLFKAAIPATGTFQTEYIFDTVAPAWRDFKLTGPSATGVAVQIWYRA